MALTTEVHIPASPTPAFANMLFFLISSLARNAEFPGRWKVVVTLGRDGDLTPDSPELAWSRDFPVEFQWADPALWDIWAKEAKKRQWSEYIYNATILHQLAKPYDSDVVMFLDADMVVVRTLADIVRQAHEGDLLAAKPAWQPPDVDLDAILERAGLRYDGPPITYSGYGWSFTEPRYVPPYINSGFTVCSRRVANLLQRDLPRDFAIVDAQYPGRYIWQVAQMLTIVRNGIGYLPLDERYNLGIGEPGPSILPGEEGAQLEALGREQERDARVIHYCTPAQRFVRRHTMASDEALRTFLAEPVLGIGEGMLQAAFLPFRDAWENRRLDR